MVYCNLINVSNERVTYYYGGYADDLTGIVSFDIDTGEFEIHQEPKNSFVPIRHLHSLYYHHKDEYRNKIFKQNIAYEI